MQKKMCQKFVIQFTIEQGKNNLVYKLKVAVIFA